MDYTGNNAGVLGDIFRDLANAWNETQTIIAGALGSLASASPVVAAALGVGAVVYGLSQVDWTEGAASSRKNGDYYVYKLQDCTQPGVNGEACKVEYVGRTGNLDSARTRHKSNPYRSHLELERLEEPMSYDESRVKEQYYIKYYRTLNKYNRMNNQINGLSPSKYEKYKPIIDSLGEDITYVGGSLW